MVCLRGEVLFRNLYVFIIKNVVFFIGSVNIYLLESEGNMLLNACSCMKISLLIVVSCLLIGGAAGFVAGNILWEEPDVVEEVVVRQSPHWNRLGGKSGSASKESGKALNRLVLRLRYEMAPDDWAAELRKLEEAYGNLDKGEGQNALLLLLAHWMKHDPYEALRVAKVHEMRQGLIGELVLHWSSFDVEATARYLKEDRKLLYSGFSSALADEIARKWAGSDPDAAWAWMTGEWEAGMGFFEGLAKAHPQRMREFVDKWTAGDSANSGDSSNFRKYIIKCWVDRDVAEAVRWVEDMSDRRQKAESRDELIIELAAKDWALANSLRRRWEETVSDEAILEMSREISDHREALNWVVSNQAEGLRLPVERMWRWANTAPEEAQEWMLSLSNTALRDEACRSYLRGVMDKDPGKALKDTSLLSNSEERLRQMDTMMTEWANYDREAAQGWLNSYQGTGREMMVLTRALKKGEESNE